MPSPSEYGADWTPVERGVLGLLAAEQDLSQFGILRQALRLYQMHHRRLKNGETVSWSGDAARAREFSGPEA
ncbi:MAG: transcriptional regulator [Rhizorhabdus sp.]|nr:transcriptional regulator [Rhizorhabdus sp.]